LKKKPGFKNIDEARAGMIERKLFKKSDEKYVRINESKNMPGCYDFTIDKKYYRDQKNLLHIAKFLTLFQKLLKIRWRIIDYIDLFIDRYFNN